MPILHLRGGSLHALAPRTALASTRFLLTKSGLEALRAGAPSR